MKFLLRYLEAHKGAVLIGFILVVLTSVTGLLGPWILKYAVDGLSGGLTKSRLWTYAGWIMAAAVIQGIFRYYMRVVLIGVSRRIEYTMRLDIFDRLQALPPEYYQTHRTGDIITRSSSDLENVRLFLGPGLMNLLSTIVTFITAVALMSSISPRLTLFSLIPLPLASILMAQASAVYYRRYKAVQEASSRMSDTAQENFAGIRVVKVYTQENHQSRLFELQCREYRRQNLRLARLIGFFHPAVGFIIGLAVIIVLFVGGRMIITRSISLGDLVAFLGLMGMLIYPTIALGWVVNLFQRGLASAARIEALLATVPAIAEPERPAPLDGLSGAIKFDDLTFTYPGSSIPALRNIVLDIKPGAKIALVGRTGSGKSTLACLIPRLFNSPPGGLKLDGHDVNSISLDLLRRTVSFVPQESFLFSETIGWNIDLGLPQPPVPVDDAVRLAGLEEDMAAFPEGARTLVGERGLTLSGGQKQRTALARALVRDPRILILDDAFASVDAVTERRILKNLRAFMAGRTVIIISHRLVSIADADEIIVLDGGRISERGNHRELLARGGWYADIYRRQQLLEEITGEAGRP